MENELYYINRNKVFIKREKYFSFQGCMQGYKILEEKPGEEWTAEEWQAWSKLICMHFDVIKSRVSFAKKRNSRIANDPEFAKRVKHQHATKPSRFTDRMRRQAMHTRPACQWANKQAIKAFYVARDELRNEKGIEYHVDHIVPLVGKDADGNHIVCGLHNEFNLRVVTKKSNLEKGCYFNPDKIED